MEQITEQKLEALIEEALHEAPDISIPDHFTDHMVSAMAQQGSYRESMLEFFYKCLIALGAFLVFALIFFFISIKDLAVLKSYLIQNKNFITAILITGVFVLFADQVFLKYLFKNHQTS